MNGKKIILIGAGAVGCSFLYSALNRGLASEYGIIDVNEANVEGQVLDLEDAIPAVEKPFNVFKATYQDCKDADIVVITAGRPQLPGETRLNMVEGNAKIMKDIALNVKNSGFNGITIIASNPVDVLTYVYQEVTGYDKTKVLGSGTSLDSSRLVRALSLKTNVSVKEIEAFVIGEHGDSSVSAFGAAKIKNQPLLDYWKEHNMNFDDLAKIHESVWKKAYEIIERKRATFYGIGANLANIVSSIFNDTKKVIAIGVYLEGQYKNNDIYIGVPAVVGKNGMEKIVEIPLSDQEQDKFNQSIANLKDVIMQAKKVI